MPGAADTAIEQEADQAQLRIAIDRQEVARYGINVRDVEDVIEMAIGGRPVSTVFEGERRFDVTVRYTPEARTDITAIGNILVPTREGGRVPLSQLADIKVLNGASIIARRENKRQISVRTNIRGRDQGSFVAEAQRRLQEAVKLPAAITWTGADSSKTWNARANGSPSFCRSPSASSSPCCSSRSVRRATPAWC